MIYKMHWPHAIYGGLHICSYMTCKPTRHRNVMLRQSGSVDATRTATFVESGVSRRVDHQNRESVVTRNDEIVVVVHVDEIEVGGIDVSEPPLYTAGRLTVRRAVKVDGHAGNRRHAIEFH